MKKIALILSVLLMSLAVLVSCSKENEEEKKVDLSDPTLSIFDCIEVPYQYDLTPYITIEKDDYTGLEYTKIDTTVTDADLNEAIGLALEEFATSVDVTDRGAEMGDTIVIDFKGSVDGEYFDGGEATDFETVLGQAGFIEGFEEALVGHMAGEEFVIDVTFPEGYSEELGGKAAKFEINMKSVKTKVLPDLNEEFILNNTTCKTVEEFITFVTENVALQNIEEAKGEQREELFARIYNNVKITDYPEEDYKYYYDDYVSYFEAYAQINYGVDLVTFITQIGGITEEEFEGYANSEASKYVERDLIVFAIANAENLIADLKKADYDAHVAELAEYYGITVTEFEAEAEPVEVWKSVISEKVFDFLFENSTEVEPKEEEITEESIIIEGVTVTE